MTRLSTSSVSLAYPVASHPDLEAARRLIVLVPAEAETTAAARRVWELANALECQILFFSLYTDAAQEASLRRQLVTMSAMIQSDKVCADVHVESGSNWMSAVKSTLQAGDMIVCFAEQRAGLMHRPLSQILQSNLNAPVYILSGLYPQNLPQASLLSQILGWMGSIGIIVATFLLQIRIVALSENWAQTTLLVLSVIGEVLAIWGWNSLFS